MDGALPFNRIVINELNQRSEITLQEFQAMPVSERIRHILGRTLEFYLNNAPVDRNLALKSIQARQVSAAAGR